MTPQAAASTPPPSAPPDQAVGAPSPATPRTSSALPGETGARPTPGGDHARSGLLPGAFAGLGARRVGAGAALLVIGLPLLTALLVEDRDSLPLATPVLLVLLLVVTATLLGGLKIAVPGAIAGGLLLNWFFTPPYGSLSVDQSQQLVVLGVYVAVALAVSLVVDLAARRTAEADRARAEALALGALAGATLAEQQTLPDILSQVAEVFGMPRVSLQERDRSGWREVEGVRGVRPPSPDDVELRVSAGPDLALSVSGPELFAADLRVLTSFAEAAATALEGRRLAARASHAVELEAADRMRTALLAAVGHDLRTPLAGVKAAVTSLRQTDITWTPSEADELLATIEDSADRLQTLVANLLDASRLQAGVVSPDLEPVGLDEVVGRAMLDLADPHRVHVVVGEDLPDMLADVGLVERVLANVLENALRYSPAGLVVTVRGMARPPHVVCEVVDHGPGLPESQWATVFGPFQRLGDRTPGGVGLGLAVARGFTEAMGGTLVPSHTPGGGLTMRLSLPMAATSTGP